MVEKYPEVPDDVMLVIHGAAIEEDGLRRQGARPERIKEVVGKKLAKRIIDLTLEGKDTHHAFPPENTKSSSRERELTDAEEARVDYLVDTGVMTYHEALRRVRGC